MPAPSQVVETSPKRSSTASVDLRFLLDRRAYHQIPIADVAPAFLESTNQPATETPLTELLEHGHYRRAAEAALREIFQCRSNDADRILQLLYTRLACLVVISRPDLAADEALPLTDFLNRAAPASKDLIPHVPWELRLLLVRLQSIVAADGGRRALMALYSLTAEVRANLQAARTTSDVSAIDDWTTRLQDLGFRVADSLVEMGELETATRHLDTLPITPSSTSQIQGRKTLLRIRVGDVSGAQASLSQLSESPQKEILSALLTTADGDFDAALTMWRDLSTRQPANELLGTNLAVCLLYTGRMTEAREILEGLAKESGAFGTLLFNVGTVYELCTERAMERKAEMAHHFAAKTPDRVIASGGWERSALDFKL